MKLIFIIMGASIGAVGRYLLASLINASVKSGFPWGTLAVNLIGCLIIGLAWGLSERGGWSPLFRSFLFIGILGSFTTFSSFGLETVHLIRAGTPGAAASYILASNLGGVGLVWAGLLIGGSAS